MRNFVVFVEGSNFNLEIDGKIQLMGFFATRRVEAKTEDEAANIVLERIVKEPELGISNNAVQGIESSLNAKNVYEMPPDHENKYHGFTFFPMERK